MGRLSKRPRLSQMNALVLLAIVLIGAACAPATSVGPAATSAPAPAGAQPVAPTAAPAQPAANTPIAASQPPAKKADLPVGVDADGNFYRGDPKAPVKLVEFSDFQ